LKLYFSKPVQPTNKYYANCQMTKAYQRTRRDLKFIQRMW